MEINTYGYLCCVGSRQLLYAYVDETGDRGVSAKSSPFFAMAGFVIAAEDEHRMRTTAVELRQSFAIPRGKGLHWKDHVKVYPRRRLVADKLAAIPDVRVNYVIFEKAAIPAGSGLYIDHTIFYNYVAGLMMERLLLSAKYWPGGTRDIQVRFGHVKGFDHAETIGYFRRKSSTDPSWIPWQLLRGSVKFSDMSQYDGLQIADLYAGILKAAIMPDPYGGYEEHHFLRIRHQIRRAKGTCWGAGFKVMAQAGTIENLPWWPQEGL